MRINTKLKRLELTKRERDSLETAKSLLLDLVKHGDGAVAESAEIAAEEIGKVSRELAMTTVGV